MNKKTNPLFVVTQKGSVVEEATGLIDAVLKKLGLSSYCQYLEEMFAMFFKVLQESTPNYALFVWAKEVLDQLVKSLENIVRKIDPLLAFQWFR